MKNLRKQNVFIFLFVGCALLSCIHAMKKRTIEDVKNIEEQKIEKKQKLTEEEFQQKISELMVSFIENIRKGDKEFIKKYLDLTATERNLKKMISDMFNKQIMFQGKDAGTLLIIALGIRQFEIAQLILESGVMTQEGLNIQDKDGNTALMWTIEKSQVELAKLLIHQGADLNLQNNKGLTALIQTFVKKLFDLALLMIGNKNISIDTLNAPDSKGQTPLMWAVLTKNNEIARSLIKKGVNLDLKNNRGFTALMGAIVENDYDSALLILEKGADLNLSATINNITMTPLYCAFARYYQNRLDLSVVKALLLYGGDFGSDSMDIFENNKVLSRLFVAVTRYKTSVENGKESALYDEINETDSPFTTYEWLRLAIIRDDQDQIQYCINKKLFTKDDVKYLTLYLKEIRQKTPEQILTLVDEGKYSAYDVVYSFVNTRLDMFLDIVPQLLEMIQGETIKKNNGEEFFLSAAAKRDQLLQAAKKRNNKKLGKKIVEFNKVLSGLRNKEKAVFLFGEENIDKKIASFLE